MNDFNKGPPPSSAFMESVSTQLVTELAEDARCSVCHDEYKDARFLSCHHYFCRECIDRCLMADPTKNVLACPECRKEMPLPISTDKLEPAFPANRLVSQLREARIRLTEVKQQEGARDQVQKYSCNRHGKKLEYFCFECNQLMCEVCTHNVHEGHRYEHVREAAENHREVIKCACDELKATKEEIEKSEFTRTFAARKDAILQQAEGVSTEVCQSFDEMIRALGQRKVELLKSIQESKERKLANLTHQEGAVVSLVTNAGELVDKVSGVIQSSSDPEFLNVAHQLLEMTLSCRDGLSKVCLEPAEITNLVAQIDCVEEVSDLCQSKATVTTLQLQGIELGLAEVREPRSFLIHPSAPISIAVTVSATLKPLHSNAHIPVMVAKVPGSALYKATYTPLERGRHHLVVEVDGQPVAGSPLHVCVYPKSSSNRMPDFVVKTSNPTCVAVNSEGLLVVSSSIKNRVAVYTKKGKKLFELKGRKLSSPHGVAVDRDNNIFVTEDAAHVVSKFSKDGKFVKSVGSQGSQPGEFDSPKGVNVIRNRVFVCDQKNSRIQVLSTDLRHLATISTEFQVTDIAPGVRGNFYVVGTGGSQGIHFYEGIGFTHQNTISHRDLCSLSGVCFDTLQGFIYAVDFINCCVVQLTPIGDNVASFCRRGTGDGQLLNPCGIVVDLDGYLYVCDSGNNRILVF